jgi:hypothetical protein
MHGFWSRIRKEGLFQILGVLLGASWLGAQAEREGW